MSSIDTTRVRYSSQMPNQVTHSGLNTPKYLTHTMSPCPKMNHDKLFGFILQSLPKGRSSVPIYEVEERVSLTQVRSSFRPKVWWNIAAKTFVLRNKDCDVYFMGWVIGRMYAVREGVVYKNKTLISDVRTSRCSCGEPSPRCEHVYNKTQQSVPREIKPTSSSTQ